MTKSGWKFFCSAILGGVAFNVLLNWGWLTTNIWPLLTEHRILGWVGALSGWVAAAVALVTIKSLSSQAEAAQKQTEFIIGDAPPTMDAVQHKSRPSRVVVRILNWNRRSMIIRELRLVGADDVTIMRFSFASNFLDQQEIGEAREAWGWAFGTRQIFDPAMTLEGWVEREQQPKMVKFGLQAHRRADEPLQDDWRNLRIEVGYELVGALAGKTLEAHIHLATSGARIDEEILELAAALPVNP